MESFQLDDYKALKLQLHQGHNPHPELSFLCIGICLTSPDRDRVTNVAQRPW